MKGLRNMRRIEPNGATTWWIFRRVGHCERSASLTYDAQSDRSAIARRLRMLRARLRRDISEQRKAMLR